MKRKSKKAAKDFSFDFSSLSFGISQTKEPEVEEIPKLSLEPVLFENAEKMAMSIDWEHDYFALVSGNFIFGDFIEALCLRKNLNPSVIYLTTLGMSEDNIDSIVNLVDYLGAQKVHLLVSNYFTALERHKLVPYMEREFSGRPIDVAVLASHCKIAIILSEQGDAIITGSANLSSSNNIEQFILTHDPKLIAFCKNRLDSIMNRFKVIDGLSGQTSWSNNTNNTGRKAWAAMEGD